MKRGSLRIVIAAGIALGVPPMGCSSSSGEPISEPHPTLVEVDPDLFLKDVPCGSEPGAMQMYVATLYDMTPLGEGGAPSEAPDLLELPSSSPVSCIRSVAFSLVVPGHQYTASVQGYARSDLEVAEPGVPILVDPITRKAVEPDWIARCGDPPPNQDGSTDVRGVTSEYQVTRKVQPCDPLVRRGAQTPTVLAVSLDAETCAAKDVESFSLRRNGETVGSAACGETIELRPPDIEPGQFIELELLAYAADSESPTAGTLCTAKVLDGVRVTASCAELSGNGSISINVPDVLRALGATCSDAPDVVLSIPSAMLLPIRLERESCRGIARFSDLPPGSYTIQAESKLLSRTTTCLATVEPGFSTLATCSESP